MRNGKGIGLGLVWSAITEQWWLEEDSSSQPHDNDMRTSEEGEDTEARTPARLDVGSRIIFGLVGIGIVYMFLPAPLTVKTVVFSILNPNGIWFVIGAFAIWSGISGRNLVDFRRR